MEYVAMALSRGFVACAIYSSAPQFFRWNPRTHISKESTPRPAWVRGRKANQCVGPFCI